MAGEMRGYAIIPQAAHLKQRSPCTSAMGAAQAPQKRCVRAHSAICPARPATPIMPSSTAPNRLRRLRHSQPGGAGVSRSHQVAWQ